VDDKRNDDSDWLFDPEIAALDRGIRRELREEAEALELDVHEAELRERHMVDIAHDMHNRGDFVALATSRRTFTGHVVSAGRDVVTVRTDSFDVDVHLDDVAYLRVVEPRRGPAATPRTPSAGTFELCLMEKRSAVERVELGYRNLDDTIIGAITAVGQDHLVLVDDQREQWFIALNAVSWVIRRGRKTR
jgi:hypothetical protein